MVLRSPSNSLEAIQICFVIFLVINFITQLGHTLFYKIVTVCKLLYTGSFIFDIEYNGNSPVIARLKQIASLAVRIIILNQIWSLCPNWIRFMPLIFTFKCQLLLDNQSCGSLINFSPSLAVASPFLCAMILTLHFLSLYSFFCKTIININYEDCVSSDCKFVMSRRRLRCLCNCRWWSRQ